MSSYTTPWVHLIKLSSCVCASASLPCSQFPRPLKDPKNMENPKNGSISTLRNLGDYQGVPFLDPLGRRNLLHIGRYSGQECMSFVVIQGLEVRGARIELRVIGCGPAVLSCSSLFRVLVTQLEVS